MSSRKLSEVGEFDLVELASQFNLIHPERVVVGVGDDCAVVRGEGRELLLLTTDVMIDTVHFRRELIDPESLGEKLLRINISDIAAMGGEPREALLCSMLTADLDVSWVERLYRGLNQAAETFGVNIVGGDTSQSPHRLALVLTLTGRVDEGDLICRSGGRPGDLLFVSGTLGGSDAGLAVLTGETVELSPGERDRLTARHLRPEPRLDLGQALAASGVVTAMTDLSDGLAVDLPNICRASGLAAELVTGELPIAPELGRFCRQRDISPQQFALKAGGDYELLFAVEPDRIDQIEKLSECENLPRLTQIGRLTDGEVGEVIVVRPDGQREVLKTGGWEHFRR